MSWAQAAMVVLAFLGACSLAYLFGSFWTFHVKHRRIMRRRRWPKQQHDSYFRDMKNWPEQ